jgi:YCII-related domain-containing protein
MTSARITDEFMRDMLGKSRAYTLVLLKAGPNRDVDGADATVWEHARRNFEMRADGVLAIVCPITDDGDWRGIGIFDAPPDEVAALMDGDPGVQTGVFEYEVHPVRSFPGDSLP